jgi:hypothetical protein
MWSSFFVTTGPDGAFAFDALAPGSYVVYPMLRAGGGKRAMDNYLRRVEVALGTKPAIDIDATPGPVTLTVSAKTEKGAPLPMAGLMAIRATINARTAEELRDGTQMPSNQLVPMHGRGIQNGSGTIEGMHPGTYTLCAGLGDARVASSVKLTCTHLKVTSAPKQSASIVVPAAWVEGNQAP